ncbi:Glycoside hydrolase [Phytophthora cinnamomi]|uniref:Glycoside hydrolase n=1 Tax=Phytophthora cinnamomi TaxID=4785 RepID=UPI00355A8029|nr:Glycoside hydrolase [Phytophthora cinnamomi]
MQLLGASALAFVAFQGSVQAAITCTTTADCAWGETCVAGDSDTSVQACVPPTVCGGSSMGNCPSDDSGKLACLWRPYNDCSEGCAILNGNKGIYKCVSIARCDAYYGGSSCSDGCSVNGVRCNGQGSCNMMSTNADGTPSFGCTCDNGYSGSKCEVAPGSTVSNSSSTTNDDDDSFWGSLDDEDSASDAANKSTDQSDDSAADTSDAASTNAEQQDSSTATSKKSKKSALKDSSNDASVDLWCAANGYVGCGKNNATSDDGDNDASASSSSNSSSSDGVANSASVSSASRGGIRAGVLILVLVMAAFFLIGTVLLVAYSRRRKQQEAEEYASALASSRGVGAVGERDLAAGHTGRTPRANIATM